MTAEKGRAITPRAVALFRRVVLRQRLIRVIDEIDFHGANTTGIAGTIKRQHFEWKRVRHG